MKPGRHRAPVEPWGWVIAAALLAAYAGLGTPLTALAIDSSFTGAEPWWLGLVVPSLSGFVWCCNKALTIR